MKIMGIDPGGTTGLATYDMVDDHWEVWELGPEPHHWELHELLMFDTATVVCESFQYQRRELDKGVSLVLDSVEYIGIVKLVLGGSQHLVFQTPAQGKVTAKNFWTDEKLKQLGLYEKTNSAHQRDAVGHILYYVTFTLKDDRFLRRLAPS
jgi:hypothetical protein